MTPAGFEPAISAGEPKTYALGRAATAIGVVKTTNMKC